LLTGGKLILLDRFSGDEALQAVSTHASTVFNGSPTHFKLLLKAMDRAAYRSNALRLSVGTAAFFPPELINQICDRLGVQFMFMYGSSEGVGVATTDREDMLKGSVGRPSPGSVLIVGEDRQPLPIGHTGEIAFSRNVFPVRYWEENGVNPLNAEGQKQSDSPGVWYYSGDMGRLDEDGRLYVYGRVKHQIDRGGLKVDPVEVELALARCSGVTDAAVLGRPNPVLGETVCACVVGDKDWTLSNLRSALQNQLAAYKLPEELFLLHRIPRTQLGKVDLAKLKSEISQVEQR
jgi:acyl-coenzyme A synthetase/AMP-(fatty) acid ligase